MERDFAFVNPSYLCNHFNSHAHVERDHLYVCKLLPLFQFQLTRSRGAWRWFQPPWRLFYKISTHTLTWSVTCIIDKTIRFVKFQLTRSRGAWLIKSRDLILLANFNSHAHVERDETVQKSIHCLKNFNSHAHVERDVLSVNIRSLIMKFQLTRSRGAWLPLLQTT